LRGEKKGKKMETEKNGREKSPNTLTTLPRKKKGSKRFLISPTKGKRDKISKGAEKTLRMS